MPGLAISSALRELGALLAPPACAACRAPLPARLGALCSACRARLPWLPARTCPRCALARHGTRGLPRRPGAVVGGLGAAGLRRPGPGARPRAEVPRRAAGGRRARRRPGHRRAAGPARGRGDRPGSRRPGPARGQGLRPRRSARPRARAGGPGCELVPCLRRERAPEQVGAARRRSPADGPRDGLAARRPRRPWRCSSTTSTPPARRWPSARGRCGARGRMTYASSPIHGPRDRLRSGFGQPQRNPPKGVLEHADRGQGATHPGHGGPERPRHQALSQDRASRCPSSRCSRSRSRRSATRPIPSRGWPRGRSTSRAARCARGRPRRDLDHSVNLIADELSRQVKRHRDKRRARRAKRTARGRRPGPRRSGRVDALFGPANPGPRR